MDDLIFYNMTCHTPGCVADNITVRGMGPRDTVFGCGSCSKDITDWEICPDQETKDGCVAFCPNSESHRNWAECFNASMML